MHTITCPHCKCIVEIQELNCRIFRHGIYKHNGKQMNPHLPKNECETLYREGKIWGCGKPFYVSVKTNQAEVCDYI